jgi:hypothetical protein
MGRGAIGGMTALLGVSGAVACGAPWPWPGSGGAPVKSACEPGPLAVHTLLKMSCAPLVPLIPPTQQDKPCWAESDGTRRAFDAAGNLIAPDNLLYTYRPDGNVERAVMHGTIGIEYIYDAGARLVFARALRSDDETVHQISYDFVDGRLLRERSSAGVRNEYLYQGDTLLRIASFSSASFAGPETAILFEYDALGRRSAEQHIDSGVNAARYEYGYDTDDSERLTQIRVFDTSSASARLSSVTARTFDRRGRLASIATDADADGVWEKRISLVYCDR